MHLDDTTNHKIEQQWVIQVLPFFNGRDSRICAGKSALLEASDAKNFHACQVRRIKGTSFEKLNELAHGTCGLKKFSILDFSNSSFKNNNEKLAFLIVLIANFDIIDVFLYSSFIFIF